jgi:hypothetical protein
LAANRSTVNWGKRIISIVAAVLFARKGLLIALVERAKEGKATGDELVESITNLVDDY